MAESFTCPICGYPHLTEAPRGEEGSPSYEICPSCFFEFGYDDDDQGHTYGSWRNAWIAAGMPWGSSEPAPPGWDPAAQLRNLARSS